MMKKRTLPHLKKSVIAGLTGLLLSTNAFAAESITDLMDYLQKVVNTTAETVANYIYELNSSLPNTILANVSQQKAEKQAQSYNRALSFCQVYNALPRSAKATNVSIPDELRSLNLLLGAKSLTTLCEKATQQFVFSRDPKSGVEQNNTNQFKSYLYNLPATDSPGVTGVQPAKLEGETASTTNTALGNNDLNFDSMIVPSLYSDDQRKNALNFISLSGRLYEPFPANAVQVNQARDIIPVPEELIDYQVALRSFVAAQSISVSNFYKMISDRTEQPEVARLNLKNQQGEVIKSPFQYREYQVNRRNNQEWYDMVNSAPSTTIARETLLVLAEIQRSLQRLEQTNERMLATFSIMELQNMNLGQRPELKGMSMKLQNLVSPPTSNNK